jgi:transcription antitermination factor NusG
MKRELEVQATKTFENAVFDALPWWAVYTRHHHEKVVAEMLSAKGFEVFLPLYESTRRWKDRRMVLSLPLFPCYLFVRGGLDRKLQVVTTPGIHMILYRGEKVAVIPDQEIAAIQKAVDGPCGVEPHPFLKCGTRVRVNKGALEGVEGILIRKKNLFRLILSVDMLQQSVSVEVHASDVEPCAAANQELAARSPAFFSGQNEIRAGSPLRVATS